MKKILLVAMVLPFILFDCSPVFSAPKKENVTISDHYPWTRSDTLRDKFGR